MDLLRKIPLYYTVVSIRVSRVRCHLGVLLEDLPILKPYSRHVNKHQHEALLQRGVSQLLGLAQGRDHVRDREGGGLSKEPQGLVEPERRPGTQIWAWRHHRKMRL
eukprot:scaffold539_cov359-Prasinococcus_capsulatus_cf.AAC.35